MRVTITLNSGEEKVYDNIAYITNAVSFYSENGKFLYTISLMNAVEHNTIELNNVKNFCVSDSDMYWIHNNGKRTCPRCGTTYGKSVKIDMRYCPFCGHQIYY